MKTLTFLSAISLALSTTAANASEQLAPVDKAYQTLITNLAYEQTRALPHVVQFEEGYSDYMLGQLYYDNDWTWREGKSQNTKSGPLAASQGDGYLYFNTGPGGAVNKGDESVVDFWVGFPESTITPLVDGYMTFDYHMYGNDIGHLAVEVFDIESQDWVEVWRRGGQKQRSASAAWISQYVSLEHIKASGSYRFKATANGGQNGEIAIDNIRVDSHGEEGRVKIDTYRSDPGYWLYFQWNIFEEYMDYTTFFIGTNVDTGEVKYIADYIEISSESFQPTQRLTAYYEQIDLCEEFGFDTGFWDIDVQVWAGKKPETAAQLTNMFGDHFSCNTEDLIYY